jgi:predicted NAD/FAD-dependent oxidoreductase
MSALGKTLVMGLESGDALINLETKALVKGLHHNDTGWKALLDDGRIRSGGSLILNMPAPQALRLSKEFLKPEVKMALEAVRFEPCWAVILVLEQLPYLDWVGIEIEHPVLSWAALDHTKRNVGDPPVLVLHASPPWSRKHLEYNQSEVLALVLEAARELLGDWVGQHRIAQAHRWRYAWPSQTHPWPYLAQGNLVFCGDWCSEPMTTTSQPHPQGRIEGALESGWAAAEYLLEYLKN